MPIVPDPEVTWQVAFFALVPLALGCMTQPVGRVFDAPPELRVWLRANPLICAGDIFQYLLRILSAYAVEPCWSWRPLKSVLADRFRDTDWSAPRPQFEQAALGRWALVLLGGILSPTVKLMAMRGIPVTQSLALMYAMALVFGEVVNIAAEVTLRRQATGPPSQLQQLSPKRQRLSNHVWFLLHALHALPVWWLTATLLGTIEKALDSKPFIWGDKSLASISCLAIAIFGRMDLILGEPSILTSASDMEDFALEAWTLFGLGHARLGDGDSGPLLVTAVHLLMLSAALPIHLHELLVWRGVIGTGYTVVFVSGMTCATGLLFSLLCWLGWKALRRLGRSRLGQILGIPRGSLELGWAVSFLNLLICTVLSYAFVFDGTGTGNPPWLAIFG